MATVREQIVDAVQAALNGVGKPTGLTIYRMRPRPLEEDDLPAAFVFWFQETVDEGEGDLDGDSLDTEGAVERSLALRIEIRAKASAGQDPDTALDALYAWTVQAIMADGTFGGLALRTREVGTALDMAERNALYASAQVTFTVLFQTSEADPEESRV